MKRRSLRAVFEIDFHRGLGNLIKLGGNHFQPGGFEGFADGVEVGHGGLDFPHVALVAQIIGTGFECGFHQLVFGVLFLRELDDALAFELPAHTAVFAHGPAALAHQMADFGHGTVTVVGRGFHDDGDAARTVTFVVDFYDVAAGILPGTLRMAASILSLGRLIDLAAAMAARRRELLAGSPPFLAAMMISLAAW